MYLELGWSHITDLNGFDHIVYLIALLAVYGFGQLKRSLWLITAFTIGHSLTLVLATAKIIAIPSEIIEFLIPVTIAITAIINLWNPGKKVDSKKMKINYFICLAFGFIHGLGFSNYFLALLGKEQSIISPLLAFNLGIELGQVLIGLCIFTAAFLARRFFNCKNRDWVLVVSGGALALALSLMIETKFW
jgi:hypothetical protein